MTIAVEEDGNAPGEQEERVTVVAALETDVTQYPIAAIRLPLFPTLVPPLSPVGPVVTFRLFAITPPFSLVIPLTSRLAAGVVVPIPTLPLLLTTTRDWSFVSSRTCHPAVPVLTDQLFISAVEFSSKRTVFPLEDLILAASPDTSRL